MFLLCRKTLPILICLDPQISFWDVQTTWLREFKGHWLSNCHRWLKNVVFHSWFHCLSLSSVKKKVIKFPGLQLLSQSFALSLTKLYDFSERQKGSNKWIHDFQGVREKRRCDYKRESAGSFSGVRIILHPDCDGSSMNLYVLKSIDVYTKIWQLKSKVSLFVERFCTKQKVCQAQASMRLCVLNRII